MDVYLSPAPQAVMDTPRIHKGQLIYEFEILKGRLKHRTPKKYKELLKLERTGRCPKPQPIFVVIEGDVEPWKKSYWRARNSTFSSAK